MQLTNIVSLVNSNLAGELLTFNQMTPFLDQVIDEINDKLNTTFPAFSEFDPNTHVDYPDYNFFPDMYIRSVVCVGAAFYFYITDEEGVNAAPMYQEMYRTALFRMERDYLPKIAEIWKKPEPTGYLPDPFAYGIATGDYYDRHDFDEVGSLYPLIKVYEEGPQGIPGIQGPPGEQGISVINVTEDTVHFYVHLSDGTIKQLSKPAGIVGDKGETGPQGPQGIQGLKGETGPRGEAGPRGIQGVPGIQGPQGVEGPRGPQGIQGPKGDIGPAGPKGDVGPEGPQGIQGLKGDKGNAGSDGVDGIGIVNISDTSETLFTVNLTNSTSYAITKAPSYNYALNVTAQYTDESELPLVGDLGQTVLVNSNLFIYTLNGWFNAGNLTTVDYDVFINIDGGLFTDPEGGVDIGTGGMAALEAHIEDPDTHENLIIDGNKEG